MKNDLIFIVQQCICIDSLINAIITSNIYIHSNFFNIIKRENIRNIKLIYKFYKHTYTNKLLIKNNLDLKIDPYTKNNINILTRYILNILNRIDILKKQYFNSSYNSFFENLYKNYFVLIYYIHYFLPLSSNTYLDSKNEEYDNLKLNYNKYFLRFFNILNPSTSYLYNNEEKFELIRNICIKSIYISFDYDLNKNLIIDEQFEIFFENNPQNKFYQFFFKSNDRRFKIRIYDNSLIIFYIYQVYENPINIYPPLNKIDCKLAIDTYLKEKFKEDFENLFYDKNYISSYYHKNNIESYKFKYIYNNESTQKFLYLSININSRIIQEIYLE